MENEKEQPKQIFEWVDSRQGTPEIYGNFFNTSWTLFDVRFQVGALIPKRETDLTAGFVVEKRGAVTIAWPEAKALMLMLADLVRRYESVNGEMKPLKITPVTLEDPSPKDE